MTRYEPGPSASHILSIVDFLGTRAPDPTVFVKPPWLVVTERPTLTIVKYCAYADGYRRQARRYRVVSQIQLTEVPPPLTLSVDNWGSIWSHLGDRLRQRSK